MNDMEHLIWDFKFTIMGRRDIIKGKENRARRMKHPAHAVIDKL